jgi:hypothetical protein
VSKKVSSRVCKRRHQRASSEKEHLAILKKFSKRRDRRLGFAEENRKIPSVVISWESCMGFKPQRAEKEQGSHRNLAYRRIRGSEGIGFSQEEIVIHDFPRRSESLITAGTCGKRSRRVRDRGIESPVHMTAGIAIFQYAISQWS